MKLGCAFTLDSKSNLLREVAVDSSVFLCFLCAAFATLAKSHDLIHVISNTSHNGYCPIINVYMVYNTRLAHDLYDQ